jgi:hypothetical protein
MERDIEPSVEEERDHIQFVRDTMFQPSYYDIETYLQREMEARRVAADDASTVRLYDTKGRSREEWLEFMRSVKIWRKETVEETGSNVLVQYIRDKYPNAFINETYIRQNITELSHVRPKGNTRTYHVYLTRPYREEDCAADMAALMKKSTSDCKYFTARFTSDSTDMKTSCAVEEGHMLVCEAANGDHYAYRLMYRTVGEEFFYLRTWLMKRKGYFMKPGIEFYNAFPTRRSDVTNEDLPGIDFYNPFPPRLGDYTDVERDTDSPAGCDIPVYTCVVPNTLTLSEVESMQRQLRARSGHIVTFDAVHGWDEDRKNSYIHFIACKYDSFGADYAVKMVPASECNGEWRAVSIILLMTLIYSVYAVVYFVIVAG